MGRRTAKSHSVRCIRKQGVFVSREFASAPGDTWHGMMDKFLCGVANFSVSVFVTEGPHRNTSQPIKQCVDPSIAELTPLIDSGNYDGPSVVP